MQQDDHLYIGHMLDMARKALEKAKGKSRLEFDSDEDLRIILTHLIQVIGEAARGVSLDCQQSNPQIPWKAIIGMRHKVVHDLGSCKNKWVPRISRFGLIRAA